MDATSVALREAYRLYEDDDRSDDFMKKAVELLETDIDRYHRTKLLLLRSSSAKGPTMTIWFFHQARHAFNVALLATGQQALAPERRAELLAHLDQLEDYIAHIDDDCEDEDEGKKGATGSDAYADEMEEEKDETEAEDEMPQQGEASRAGIIVPVMQNRGEGEESGNRQ